MEQTVYGVLIPFLGTALGASAVFFMRRQLSDAVQRILTGFAAGVMVAASVWSLLIPAMEQAAWMGKLSFLPAFAGFWIGVLFLLGLDHLIPHLHARSNQAEGPKSQLRKTTMMVLAVTLHNIPEGMAVGVVYAGLLSGRSPRRAVWPCPSELPFRIFRRGQSSLCPSGQKAKARDGRFSAGCSRVLWNQLGRC